MTLGDDAALSPAARADLRAAGLGHLVAASGANIALLAVLAGALAAALGLPRHGRIALVLALIAVYVPLAGSGPSIQRAGVMGAATLVAALASRPALRWHALLLAAVATLAWDPLAVEAPGWQLSFAAVAAIALLAAPLREALVRRRVPRPAAEAAALTAAATLGTAPVSAAVFGTVALAGLPANLAAAALVAPITWLGLLGTLAAQVAPAAAAPFTAAAALPLGLLLEIARAEAALPGAQAAPSPALAAVACAAGALLILHAPLRRRLRPYVPLALAAGLLVALVLRDPRPGPPPPPPGTLRVTLLDVGQGDATLLQAGGHAVLVDAGPPGGAAARGLRRAGVRALDLLVGTHAQADHVGGADEVLRALPVAAVLDGRDGVREAQGAQLAAAAAERRAPLLRPLAGQRLRLGPLLLEVLWPPATPPVPGADPNDRAIVLRASAYGARVLLTADAESGVLAPLDPGPADVLKVSHHGSADPGLPALLRTVRPRAALIGVGRGNPYGHPTPQTLGALGAAGVPVLRTDRDGSVRLDLRGGRLHVQPRS
ncbi:MAG: competence protein ComEC family protein [Solirubrobacteraceae bacterium]|nr:competence protein ComEC family protein [Solirubrobacteraceae bacterium]